ncbi:hypothetical protein KEM54_005354 [Ascosphaera aggregata]|nr:hypothetical protein KEM54_005354 [Ascosphaera aggregata]
MAARDLYGAWSEPAQSTLQRYIFNACDPQNYEPNLALNLEVCDLINAKKGNAPREAAITIVSIINSRNPNVSMLALALLDICVKNCGYPFHLQISTKEFLNELVRRFPERPPIRLSRVQQRILESIEEWRQTICQTSRYKEDLGHIRDMHRLLVYKGYRFPEVRTEDAAVLNPSVSLQSAEEMEEEEREAQSAKLQELIRRGTPHDLQEANRLMKIMAGYDTRHKTDYRAKAAAEVAKVQEKARLLEEMLQGMKPGDQVKEGDVFEELANALKSAHPKIQRMCEEESDDTEAVSKLLAINDSIHRTIERYKLVKTGDMEAAYKIPKGTLGTSTGVKKTAGQELSLIDFDGDLNGRDNDQGNIAEGAATSAAHESHQEDLLGLSFSGSPQPQSQSRSQPLSATDILAGFASGPVSLPVQGNNMPALATTVLQQQPAAPDPFASLMQSTSATSTPLSTRVASTTSASNAGGLSSSFGGLSLSSPPTGTAIMKMPEEPPQTAATTSSTDDEWTFASALPAPVPQVSRKIEVLSAPVKIDFVSERKPNEPVIHVVASFSNTTSLPISELHFQVAIEKIIIATQAYTLQLTPQSGRDIAPNQQDGIRLEMVLNGIQPGNGNNVKLRYRVSYKLGNEVKEDQGHVPPLGIA